MWQMSRVTRQAAQTSCQGRLMGWEHVRLTIILQGDGIQGPCEVMIQRGHACRISLWKELWNDDLNQRCKAVKKRWWNMFRQLNRAWDFRGRFGSFFEFSERCFRFGIQTFWSSFVLQMCHPEASWSAKNRTHAIATSKLVAFCDPCSCLQCLEQTQLPASRETLASSASDLSSWHALPAGKLAALCNGMTQILAHLHPHRARWLPHMPWCILPSLAGKTETANLQHLRLLLSSRFSCYQLVNKKGTFVADSVRGGGAHHTPLRHFRRPCSDGCSWLHAHGDIRARRPLRNAHLMWLQWSGH